MRTTLPWACTNKIIIVKVPLDHSGNLAWRYYKEPDSKNVFSCNMKAGHRLHPSSTPWRITLRQDFEPDCDHGTRMSNCHHKKWNGQKSRWYSLHQILSYEQVTLQEMPSIKFHICSDWKISHLLRNREISYATSVDAKATATVWNSCKHKCALQCALCKIWYSTTKKEQPVWPVPCLVQAEILHSVQQDDKLTMSAPNFKLATNTPKLSTSRFPISLTSRQQPEVDVIWS